VKLFENRKKVLYIILGFVAVWLFILSVDVRAESELRFDGGMAVLKGETPTIGMNIKWPLAGPVNTDYELGFHLIGSSDTPKKPDSPNSITAYGMLVDGYKWYEMGLGFGLTNNDNKYHCRATFTLMAGAKWKRLTLRWYHNSSAGSCRPNTGRDLVKVGWRF